MTIGSGRLLIQLTRLLVEPEYITVFVALESMNNIGSISAKLRQNFPSCITSRNQIGGNTGLETILVCLSFIDEV